jgi:Dolichyl-phosphate-mannose-protein mannosyltransferase
VPASLSPTNWAPAAVAGVTVVGFVLRLLLFDQSLLGDELSTYWIIDGRSLGDVLSLVRSDAEITPPLYFVSAWASLELGGDPEMIRLPSLLAGTATIPLIYLVGRRAAGAGAGLVAAAVMALSPFMIHYSAEGRSYALMILLLTGSVLALLKALDGGGWRCWATYAACSCGAMLTHYTSAFPLAAQSAWAIWAHREAVRPLLLSNLAALAGFAPWIPGFIDDNNSPTTDILSLLSPFDLESVRLSVEAWVAGYRPYISLESVPGTFAGMLIAVGLALASAALVVRLVRGRGGDPAANLPAPQGSRLALLVMLALAAPVGEAIFSALGTNIFTPRNLNASWPGLAATIGALVALSGPVVSLVCGTLVLGGYAIAASKTLDPGLGRPDYAGVAALIEERAGPGDPVVDVPTFTPVPITGLDLYLDPQLRQFKLGVPETDEPFALGDTVPDVERQISQAYRAAEGGRLFLVTFGEGDELAAAISSRIAELRDARQALGRRLLRRRPTRFEVTGRDVLDGIPPLIVVELEDRGGG